MLLVKPIHLEEHSNLKQWMDSVTKILTGNVTLGDNIKCYIAPEFTMPGVAGTEFSITHNLNYIPAYFIVIWADVPVNVYVSGTAWTKTQAFFKSNSSGGEIALLIL